MPKIDQDHYTTQSKSETISKCLASSATGVSLRPSKFHHRPPNCSKVEYFLVTRRCVSGAAIRWKGGMQCHQPDCPRCQTPEAKATRMLERRGNWLPHDQAWAKAADQLQTTDCKLYLRYDGLEQKAMQSLLHGLRRSHRGQDGYVITTTDGGRHFFVTPESARFIRERWGSPAEECQTSLERVTAAIEGGYKAQRGWGVHSGAKIFSGMPRSVQSPLSPAAWSADNPGPPVSLKVFSCNHQGSRETLKRQGICLPTAPTNRDRQTGSTIDDQAIAVFPLEKETVPMMTRDEAKEFLELQRAILREQMEQTELLRKQGDRTQDVTDPHYVAARRRPQ